MSKGQNKVWHKFLAGVLAAMMVFSMFPSEMTTRAATEKYPNSVTISVVDQKGNPVQGAAAAVTVTVEENGAVRTVSQETVSTDENGAAPVLPAEQFIDGMRITADVAMEGYENGVLDAEILTADQNFLIEMAKNEPTVPQSNVTVSVLNAENAPVEGARVTVTTWTQEENSKNEQTLVTDQSGRVVVLKEKDFVPGMKISAVVTAEGYQDAQLNETTVLAADANYIVTLEKAADKEPDIRVEGIEGLRYNGRSQNLIKLTVNGMEFTTETDDTIKKYLEQFGIDGWEIRTKKDGKDLNTVNRYPIIRKEDEGTYEISVSVTYADSDLTKEVGRVTTVIQKGIIDISLSGRTLQYNGRSHEAAKLTGQFQKGDKITWHLEKYYNGVQLRDEFTHDTAIPTGKNIGDYYVELTVERKHCETLVCGPVHTTIQLGEVEHLPDIKVKGTSAVYEKDGLGQARQWPAVQVVRSDSDFTLEYQMVVDGTESAWSKEIPIVTEAGSYLVNVRAVRENYKPVAIHVEAAENAAAGCNVYIGQADPELKFTQMQTEDGVVKIKTDTDNYAAVSEAFKAVSKYSDGKIVYTLESRNGDMTAEELAQIAAVDPNTGVVKVHESGEFYVVARIAGSNDGNYKESEVRQAVSVIVKEGTVNKLLSFAAPEITYVLNQNSLPQVVNPVISGQTRGKVTYSIVEGNNGEDYGLHAVGSYEKKRNKIDQVDHEIIITDFHKLTDALNENGTLTVTVKATKEEYKGLSVIQEQTEAFYKLTIKYAPAPAEAQPYTVSPAAPNGSNGWYTSAITLTPAAGYQIGTTVGGADSLGGFVVINDEGSQPHKVFLAYTAEHSAVKDPAAVIKAGDIAAPLTVQAGIDTQAPEDLKIEFTELNLIQKIGNVLGFYNPDVTIRFEARDLTSGIDHFNWSYTREEGSSSKNAADVVDQRIEVEQGEAGKATAVLVLSASEAEQYRGHISFTATDKAGNVSNRVSEAKVFVVDTIAPSMTIQYAGDAPYVKAQNSIDTKHYFNSAVEVKLTLEEANFNAEDVKISATRNGKPYTLGDLQWQDESADIHTAVFTLQKDGDYQLTVSYTDYADNKMEQYVSETVVVDTVDPVVDIKYSHDDDQQEIEFIVTEHNFDASTLTVSGTTRNIKNEDITLTPAELTKLLREAEWEQDDKNADRYSFEYEVSDDGLYDLILTCKDPANREGSSDKENSFVVDHKGPENLKIEYAKSPLDTFLETITLGFYNPSVTVRFTAEDYSSGVDAFYWTYTRSSDASVIDNPEQVVDVKLEAKQDAVDHSRFSAEMTLNADEHQQFCGHMAVYARDTYTNKSNVVDDTGNVIIVDSIKPVMKVEYSKPDFTFKDNGKHYYHGDVSVKLTVTEANFYPEDMVINVTKNGERINTGKITWTERNKQDKSVGTFTLKAPADHSGDGDYRLTISYTDRSNNKMKDYTSEIRVIDTTLPVIQVDYQNNKPINTLPDAKGHTRHYFDKVQTAIVTVKEHNFNASDVRFEITAKDLAGNTLNLNELHAKTAWKHNGDIHTMTITYPGDANYTFDIAYTDLALNKAADYEVDYFTVDLTAPVNLRVEYSTSVLDTVLEAVDYGFYNAKMTVTITAEDLTSGVHSFLYSYAKAENVSNVNSELLNQAIAAAEIHYSEDGTVATASFEIPKLVLGVDNQFNGTVSFTAADRAENDSKPLMDSRRIVVDSIAPAAEVRYNKPVNEADGVSYYDGAISATVMVNEANFYPADVNVMVVQDGRKTSVTPSWSSTGDLHEGTFTLTEDGNYQILVNYQDKSSNTMDDYVSGHMTIDTVIEKPVFHVNGAEKQNQGGSYKNDVNVSYEFNDVTFENSVISLSYTDFKSTKDVTSQFVKSDMTENGGSGMFSIPSKVEHDGVYVMTVTITDKAMHKATSRITFTVNRFGSVYAYDDALAALIRDGGQFVVSVDKELVITEYNADKILPDSLKLLVTRDGESVEAVYTKTEITEKNGRSSEAGWYKTVYAIDPVSFAEDGVYKISLSSQYATDDVKVNESTSVPENSIDAAGKQIEDTISFTVDSKVPEIRNIVNLDQPIVNSQSLEVKYTIVDIGGLESIEVFVNGASVDSVKDFGDNQYNYSGKFTINEMDDTQSVRLKVTDLSGNVTDTESESFNPGDLYVFNDTVTVSTNFLVRWYANKPLFWGSISGMILLAAGICVLFVLKRKKKEAASAK